MAVADADATAEHPASSATIEPALAFVLQQIAVPASVRADPQIVQMLALVRERFGDSLDAVLVYGSYLRGQRDTVLDFYALLDNYRCLPVWQGVLCRLLPPNVYDLAVGSGAEAVQAKCAGMRLRRFASAVKSDFHSYFWARFAQPSLLLYCRDDRVRLRVAEALVDAATRFLRQLLPMLPKQTTTREIWIRGLALSYQAELRAERSGHSNSLVDSNLAYLQTLTQLLATAGSVPLQAATAPGEWHNRSSALQRRLQAVGWWLRRWQGKPLSLLRVAKAATMFEAPLDYLLWKIERHSGIHVEANARQRRYPLIFAWSLLWRLYRRGAFK
jgi:hypothetical protein